MAYSMPLREVMKALPKKLLPLILFGIAVTSLFSVQPAQANYIVTLEQVGPDVVATGSGAINLTGLTFFTSLPVAGTALIIPSGATIHTGPTGLVNLDLYHGVFTGPTSFGSGVGTNADTGSGDLVGIQAVGGECYFRATGLCLRCCSIG
jgi:hypothetical protein